MLRVSYINPIGYAETKSVGGKKVKLHLCTINDELWAEIQVIKNEKGEKEHILCCFFANKEHIKNCAKGRLCLDGMHYHFNTWNMGTHVNNTVFKCLTQMGAKVSFYYKEYKKDIKI